MQFRSRTLVWSAAGLLAVGTATGLAAPTLFHSAQPAVETTAAADPPRQARHRRRPLLLAPPPTTGRSSRAIKQPSSASRPPAR